VFSALTWFIIWACITFGTRVTGRITYIRMGAPIIILCIFLFKSITLEGASDGIEEYIGKYDMNVLTEWVTYDGRTTTHQILFSIGITFGIMTAYGSPHCQCHEPAFVNSCIIAISNSIFFVISGFAVFSALGHLAYLEGVPVQDLNCGGFLLVFCS
jgi:SNF family Na+-dependent transporter